jgi:hypothetical protein
LACRGKDGVSTEALAAAAQSAAANAATAFVQSHGLAANGQSFQMCRESA